jgi:hypothetical protein
VLQSLIFLVQLSRSQLPHSQGVTALHDVFPYRSTPRQRLPVTVAVVPMAVPVQSGKGRFHRRILTVLPHVADNVLPDITTLTVILPPRSRRENVFPGKNTSLIGLTLSPK